MVSTGSVQGQFRVSTWSVQADHRTASMNEGYVDIGLCLTLRPVPHSLDEPLARSVSVLSSAAVASLLSPPPGGGSK